MRAQHGGYAGRPSHGMDLLSDNELDEPARRRPVPRPPLGVDEVGVGHVQQPGDPPHQVLLVRVLRAVGEGHQPQELDHALLLRGVEPRVDERVNS